MSPSGSAVVSCRATHESAARGCRSRLPRLWTHVKGKKGQAPTHPIMSTPLPLPTGAPAATPADAAAAQRNRRIAWIVGLALAAVLAIVLVYFLTRRSSAPRSPYTPPPSGQILPSGRYRIKWADFGFLAVYDASGGTTGLFKTTLLDPKATATNATVWTYDATNGTLMTDTPENLVAIHYPAAPTSVVYLVAPQNVPQVAGASRSGWVLSGPPASIGASATPSGRITNTDLRKDVIYQGLVISNIFGVPQLVDQPAADASRHYQWAFYPVASS
ncbi:hypothetical protein psal_cds_631 [Pandoravirus salinus]|uniref:Uncharacterized protein n=1 Tax=Pandoravirus salinus TaxID=1349410 RepID=S4W2U2_9VIRU|nr:hypothetical protein psal_cds_631 [Pandoravirus salinus]AGO84520.2 hypothetical protein psal_cds_631 [Pandoravirus salinus]